MAYSNDPGAIVELPRLEDREERRKHLFLFGPHELLGQAVHVTFLSSCAESMRKESRSASNHILQRSSYGTPCVVGNAWARVLAVARQPRPGTRFRRTTRSLESLAYVLRWMKFSGSDLGISERSWHNHSRSRVDQWLAQGGRREDDFLRFLNHFHNPLADWSAAGLLGSVGQSSILWGQNTSLSGWSWQDVRNSYFDALTRPTRADRESKPDENLRGPGTAGASRPGCGVTRAHTERPSRPLQLRVAGR